MIRFKRMKMALPAFVFYTGIFTCGYFVGLGPSNSRFTADYGPIEQQDDIAASGSALLTISSLDYTMPSASSTANAVSVAAEFVDASDRLICDHLLRGQSPPDGKIPATGVLLNEADYIRLTGNCTDFRSGRGYFDAETDASPEERSFPIAFSLLVYENIEQIERLLRLVYRPHNFYCIHVDAKAPPRMHAAVEAIVRCLGNGVVVAKPAVSVSWGKVSVVEAELLCIRKLLKLDRVWRYFVNLVGRDLPLRTNAELVRILKAYDGANDVDGSRSIQRRYFPDWFQYSWTDLEIRGRPKRPAPHGFRIAKGSTHMAVNRLFVEYAAFDPKAKELLQWMSDIKVPDEHFFPTLNHNPQLRIPGAFAGDPDTKRSMARAKRWSFNPGEMCAGEWIRYVCNIGVGDLPWVVASPELFVNKIRLEHDRSAFRCLELWYRDRVRPPSADAGTASMPGLRFDLQFYAEQPFVKKRAAERFPADGRRPHFRFPNLPVVFGQADGDRKRSNLAGFRHSVK